MSIFSRVTLFLVACVFMIAATKIKLHNVESVDGLKKKTLEMGRYSCSPKSKSIDDFYELATSLTPTTDKVTSHSYDLMYGMFLGPLRNERVKMLEIGLGCNMKYGPGSSVQLWKRFLNYLELWEAEYDGSCVRSHLHDGMLDGISTLIGDQGNNATLDDWILKSTTSGLFDIIIDDGGHSNNQIFTSFQKLWPVLEKGGLYFIEDMQVGRKPKYEDSGGQNVMAEVIQDWTEQILITPRYSKPRKNKIPKDIAFIFCQLEACVIGKSPVEMGARKPGRASRLFGPTKTA